MMTKATAAPQTRGAPAAADVYNDIHRKCLYIICTPGNVRGDEASHTTPMGQGPRPR